MGLFNYVGKRMILGYDAERHKARLARTVGDAKATLTVSKADGKDLRAGYRGRYEDGGRARFAQMVQGENLDDVQIDAMGTHHRTLTIAFLLASFAALLGALYFLFMSESALESLTGITLLMVMLTFLSMALRHHFSAWQIRNRRFGGLGEFLRELL